ncbi:cytochrome B6 [Desulfocarbo indianensis]|nr:cytochrome B6 [Desulfocarbo indianensis]
MNKRMILRHTKGGIFIHWFNAACWFILLFTGLGLIQNPQLQPLGQWYPNALRAVFGGGGLLIIHLAVAVTWLLVWLVFIIANWSSHVVPFLAQVFTLKPGRDMEWMIKKNLQMTLGYKAMAFFMKPLGLGAKIPDQEYYNAGQKVAAQVMLLGALVLAVTGAIMLRGKYFMTAPLADIAWVQWAITIHYIAAGVTFGILLVHIFMAAIAKEERPAFWSMFSGEVPEEYARHHHKLWYDEVAIKTSDQ